MFALLLAVGFKVSIIDANAENLDAKKVSDRIEVLKPRIIVFVVYGQNVNAGTTNMEGAIKISKYLKLKNSNFFRKFPLLMLYSFWTLYKNE